MNKLSRENKQLKLKNERLKLDLKQSMGQIMVKDEILSHYRINQNLLKREMERELQKMEFRILELEITNKQEAEKLDLEIKNLKDEKEEKELEITNLKALTEIKECRICTRQPSGGNYMVAIISKARVRFLI